MLVTPGKEDIVRNSLAPISPRIVGIGTSTPPRSYTQEQLLELFGVEDSRVRSLFRNSNIEKRFLALEPGESGTLRGDETQGQLLDGIAPGLFELVLLRSRIVFAMRAKN